jgi:hypothetical protein
MDPAAGARRQPDGTVVLRSDRLTPAELADEVLAAGYQRFDSAKSTRTTRQAERPDLIARRLDWGYPAALLGMIASH